MVATWTLSGPSAPICRDCLALVPARAQGRHRCPTCGSPRLLAHPDRDRLSIAHVDCDAFYAAIEKRDDPSLRDRPVIVGGGRRGVVSTACYLARAFGVRSAMPMFKALAACPDAVVVKPDMEKYARVGREVRSMMLELTPLVEPLSIDEAFLDLTGTEDVHKASPAVSLVRFARKVEERIGITVSIGLAPNKFLAKIASDIDKPRGFSVIGPDEATAFLAPRPPGILPGIGKAAMERLARAGIRTVGDLARSDPGALAARIGPDALRLHNLARGVDARRVIPAHEAKTVSAETTFDRDLSSAQDLEPVLLRLCEKVAARLRKSDIAGRSVTLKLKTGNFQLRTRTRSGIPATRLAGRIYDIAHALLALETDGTRYRLIGVGVADLCPMSEADHGDLADTTAHRDVQMEEAIHKLRDRFGAGSIQRGPVFAAAKARDRR